MGYDTGIALCLQQRVQRTGHKAYLKYFEKYSNHTLRLTNGVV